MSFKKYVLIVWGVVVGSLAMVWPILAVGFHPMTRRAAAFGGIMAAVNTLFAYLLVVWSEKHSTNIFLGAVLGGMVGRMALMLGTVVIAVLKWDFPKVPLAISLLSYFVLFLVLELTFLHKKTSTPSRVG